MVLHRPVEPAAFIGTCDGQERPDGEPAALT
jgi:hypothetical protein